MARHTWARLDAKTEIHGSGLDGEQRSLGARHGASVECHAQDPVASLALRVRRAVEDMDRWAASDSSRTASRPT